MLVRHYSFLSFIRKLDLIFLKKFLEYEISSVKKINFHLVLSDESKKIGVEKRRRAANKARALTVSIFHKCVHKLC